MIKTGMIPLRSSLFHILLFLIKEVIYFYLIYFLFKSKTTQCKNHFDTNMVKVIEVLPFSCFVLFLVTAEYSNFTSFSTVFQSYHGDGW